MTLFQNEQIKQIENFPNYYITSFGRVWSEKTKMWLKPTDNKRGNHHRLYVSLGRRRPIFCAFYLLTKAKKYGIIWRLGAGRVEPNFPL